MSNRRNVLEREGILFVVSAPSGAGKTSLCKEMIDIIPGLRHSVSYTTRAIRPGEREGVDYHFVTPDIFEQMVREGAFAEWAEVHGNRYGTALKTLEAARRSGADLLLDIDCQGAAQLKRKVERGVYLFILPPSMAELERRLRGRNTESEEIIARRIANAKGEIVQAGWYDYWIVNDDFQSARELFRTIIVAEGCRVSRYNAAVESLIG